MRVDDISIGHLIADTRPSKTTAGHTNHLYAVVTSKQLMYMAGGRMVIANQMTLLPVDTLFTPLLLLAGQPGFPPLDLDMVLYRDGSVGIMGAKLRGVDLDLGGLLLLEKDLVLVDRVRGSISNLLMGERDTGLLEAVAELRKQAANLEGRNPTKEISMGFLFSSLPVAGEGEAWTPFSLKFNSIAEIPAAALAGHLRPNDVVIYKNKWEVGLPWKDHIDEICEDLDDLFFTSSDSDDYY